MKRRGFSLIEAIVSVAILGVGIAAAISAIGHLSSTEFHNRETETMLRLAKEKLSEVRADGQLDTAPIEGQFEGAGRDVYRFTVEVEPSEVENVNIVYVTVFRNGKDEETGQALTTLVFTPPVTVEGGSR